MRKSLLAAVLAGSTYAAAQPGMPVEEAPPPPPVEPAPVEAPPAPPVTVSGPPGALPPITININNTNNNTGNNSNTNTQTNNQQNPQTNNQTNEQTNTQTATQTNSVPVTVTTTVAPPSAVVPVQPPGNAVGRYELFHPRTKAPKWLAVGITTDQGVRASIDLITRGRFSVGIAASASGGGRHGHGRGEGDGGAGAVAYLAYTTKLGRLDVRAQLGFGVGVSGGDHDGPGGRRADGAIARTVTGTDTAPDGDGHPKLAPRAEAALLLGLPLTKHLGVFAGPVITASHDTDDRDRALAGDADGGRRHGGSVDKAMTAGLRWSF